MKRCIYVLVFLNSISISHAQSFEFMPGLEQIFVDAQFLEFFDHSRKISLFSRARATVAYDNIQSDLFTGAYLNYTLNSGIGGTLIGRISSMGSGIDAGIHYFNASKLFLIYALASVNVNKTLLYSWFSILRYTPALTKNWKWYTSLELFSAFNRIGHLSSVQRIRLGLDKRGYQFGLALNLGQNKFTGIDRNPGVFLRKQF